MADADAPPRSAVAPTPQLPAYRFSSFFRDDILDRRYSSSTSSDRKQKACKSSETTRNLHCYNSIEEEICSIIDGEDVSTERVGVVSSFSGIGTVVSMASFDAYRGHCLCAGVTGLVINDDITCLLILTSARLFKSLDDDSKIHKTVVVRVLLPNMLEGWGTYANCKPYYNLATVHLQKTDGFPSIQVTSIADDFQRWSGRDVVALERCYNSGKLTATVGVITNDPSEQTPAELMISTCNITKAGIGGPLFDFDGNFVGVSFCVAKETTPFVPRDIIHEWLTEISPILRIGTEIGRQMKIERSAFKGSSRLQEGVSSRKYRSQNKDQKFPITRRRDSTKRVYHEYKDPHFNKRAPPLPSDKFTEHLIESLNSRGYPLPITLDGGMRLLNSFEEEFDGDIWSKLKKNVAFNTSQSVVSLASFSGAKRFCACTGVLLGRHKRTTRVLTSASLVRNSVDANKIDDNLKIQVYLPNNRYAKGTLQHYNLHHNIALVTIRGFHCRRIAKFQEQLQVKPRGKVVAIGRVFQTGKIMATRGVLIDGQNKGDCQKLMFSTCKITKAGIGGPLIDCAGNFIGMNFYGMEESPYLPGNVILKLLRHFDAKRIVADVVDDSNPNRWTVPEPYWHYPSSVYRIYQSRRNKL